MMFRADGRLPVLRLVGLTAAALLIHGYHLGVEDAEIYIPAARKLLDPTLYPYATEFFESHGHLSLFSPILALTARTTHLSMDWTVLAWYVLTVFAMLISCWMLAAACFTSERAKWCSVLVVTAVLTMPATNTALLLMDPYLTARSLSTPLTVFVLAQFLERRFAAVGIAMAVMATIHPQMVIYLVFLLGVMTLVEMSKPKVREEVPVMASVTAIFTPLLSLAGMFPTGFHLSAATGPYREALYSRDYFFLSNWAWYHWLGMLAPMAILAWFWRADLRGTKPGFRQLSFAMLPFGLITLAFGLVFTSTHEFDMFARLQPLRSFHLITLVFVALLAGVVGEYAAKGRPWVLAAVSVPLAVGMFFVARDTYSSSPQIELPANTSSNTWVNALMWVRRNTPTNAVFAVDSRYFKDQGTDVHGFRAGAERSALADYFKDGGVVSLFPALAVEWKQMSDATYGLNHFQAADFRRLQQEYPVVSWTVIHGPAPMGMDCPYEERGYAVCRLGNAADVDAVRDDKGF
jgi:MFS family permease